ncbi:hypothetical protein [Streptomyces sp. DH12]|jgi:hypothetical protein|uniref:hypothetical protein n=1 Tax=Streptomyces sp. DH12 TaxID=2857010 RepID=UPI001E5515A2|nr:hypothetical protein [Streptomyces sp. DH12]
MSIRTGTRLLTVCAGIAGAGMAAAVPAAAAEQPPASVGAPVVSNLNSTGLLGTPAQGDGATPGKPSALPVGGGLLGGLPTGALPALPIGG